MSVNLVRMRNAAVAVKLETTPGTDAIAGTPASGDWLGADIDVQLPQQATPDPSLSGSLDRAAAIAGGIRPQLRLRVPLRGSGAPGTAPEWAPLMKACTWAETVSASAIGAPTAAASGTTTSVVAGTPFAASAQAYRGMPLLVSGDLTDITGILDYTAGKTATLGSTLTGTPTGSTLLQIPSNVRYGPTSDETVFKTVTVYVYRDGMRWKFTGCMGSWGLEMPTGGICFLTFDLRGSLAADPDATALPSGALGIARQTPPRFVAGRMQLNKLKAQTRSLQLSAGVSIILPDDPEANEGTGPAVPSERAITGSLDPYMNTTLSVNRFTAFKNGTDVSLMAIVGTIAGNRFLVTLPAVRKTAMNPTDREGLGVDAIAFEANAPDAGAFLCQF